MTYGFLPPKIEDSDFWLGSKKLGSQEINPSGDWKLSLPRFEPQRKREETSACVTFTILSDIETLEKFQYGTEPNYSDRYIAQLSGTDPARGNDPKKVCEAIRKYGLVNEEDWPFVDDINEYYKEVPQYLIDKGKKWLEKYDFGYEYVDTGKIDLALKRSPVSVAVYAWSENAQDEYVRLRASNHYTLHFLKDNFGRLLVFDSYENPFIKTLAKDHNVEFAQMYILRRKEQTKVSFWQKLWQGIKWYVGEILR
ncbi:MAG: hypothetical protein UT82_C0018G0012 [Parcubacteria group bacterium GW2011_GWB1_40_14]|nr:MAG: hypothetical protein UT82_C0018G0012 [Parcubacteria group bacterium GW2011_GWB1_40_14]